MIDADVRRAYEADGVVCLRQAFDAGWLAVASDAISSGEMHPKMDKGSWHRASSLRERQFRGGEKTRRSDMETLGIFSPTAAAARV